MRSKISLAAVAVALCATGAVAQGGPPGGHRPLSFAELDADGSGSLTSDEFLSPASERFSNLDADGDGSLTLEEFSSPALERFSAIDADGDGAVTEAELEAARPRGRGTRPQR